ncbi:hypothetical protein GCM10022237_16630 [Nocardioides ginsengisoli]
MPGKRKAERPKRGRRPSEPGPPPVSRRPGARATAKTGGALSSPPLPRPSFSAKTWRYLALGVAVVLGIGWLVWYALTPDRLPTTTKTVNASGVVGQPLYIGMFAPTKDFDRTIRISGVRVHTTADVKLKVTPLLCRRGTVGVTTKPEQFCAELVNPEGQRFTAGDSIVVRVDSDVAALAVIDRIKIAYREDIRWDTQPAGYQQALVTVAGRPEATGDGQ